MMARPTQVSTPTVIVIIGAGRIGQALAGILRQANAGASIELWDAVPGIVPHQGELATLASRAEVIFCCVPSWALRTAVMSCLPNVKPTVKFVSVAKGVEPESAMTSAELLTELLPNISWAILGGPMIAEDLKENKIGHGVVASNDPLLFPAVSTLFKGSPLELEASDDPTSVSLAGVLKNVYAAAVGVGRGLGWAVDEGFLDRAHTELVACGRQLGVSDHILQGVAGSGDFLLTATSEHSRNQRAGRDLVRGIRDEQSEVLHSLGAFIKRIDHLGQYPILRALADVIIRQRNPRQAFQVVA